MLLPIAIIVLLKMTFNVWLAGSSNDDTSGIILEPMVDYINGNIINIKTFFKNIFNMKIS